MRKRFFLILFFGITAVYIVFFPHQLKKELVFIPSWGLAPAEETAASGGSSTVVPFESDNLLGYFSPSGKLLYSEELMHGSAVSEDFFVNYSSVSDKLVIKEPSGRIASGIDNGGLPFFIHDRFFVVSPDRMSVAEYDREGSELFSITSDSLITAMDASDGIIVIGKLNGEVSVFTDDDEPDFTYFSTDSRYSAAYACAVSEDGTRFAAVTGLNPQQLICFEYRNEGYIPVFRRTITDEFRRNVLMDYSDDGKLLYLENRTGLSLFSTATFIEQKLPVEGRLSQAFFTGGRQMSFVLSADDNSNNLRVFRSDLGILADFKFPAGEFYFRPSDNCFYVGVDGKIFRYDIMEG